MKKINPKVRKTITTIIVTLASFGAGLITKTNPELGHVVQGVINTINVTFNE